MIDASWLNIGSLIFGAVAWIIPVVNLLRDKKERKWVALSISSFSACTIAICFQIFYTYHLVKIEDWTALMDTAGAMAFASATLVIVTILLNILTLILYRNQNALEDNRVS